jgi:hypothetical protein
MRSFNQNPYDLVQVLALINPCNIIPCLEQSIEVEKLKLIVNPSRETEDKIREMNLLLDFFRIRRLGL